jgi:hypothetical protein
VSRAELACGKVGDDGNVMAVQPVSPALRLLAGRAVSCCSRMTWRFAPLHMSVTMLVPCVRAHAPVGTGLIVRGRDLSCEAETCRARRRLVVRGGDSSWGVPLVGNWSEMQPTGQRLDVLPVRVLTRVLSPPCRESLP